MQVRFLSGGKFDEADKTLLPFGTQTALQEWGRRDEETDDIGSDWFFHSLNTGTGYHYLSILGLQEEILI